MLQKFFIFNTIFNDAPQPWQLGFQDSINNAIKLNYTLFWKFLIANYSPWDTMNWIELSEGRRRVSETIRIKCFNDYLLV